MPKKVAVLVRERQGEALRMAVGITLMDDIIYVYVLDRIVEETDENKLNLETMDMMDIKVYTNMRYCRGNAGLEYISTEDIAHRLVEYDLVLPY